MNLFALTDVAGSRIIRFPLSADLRDDIATIFENQANAFFDGVDTIVPFDGRYIPEEGELLSINDFADVDGLSNAVASPLSIDQYDPEVHSLDSVKALFMGRIHNNNPQILIQLFERRRLIARSGLAMFFAGNQFQKMTDSGLSLDTKLLAVIEGDALKFQSFHFARRVFELSEYFKEATNEEVTTFAGHEKLAVANMADFLESAGPQVRKKISLIRQSAVLENYSVQDILAVATTFQFPINLSEDGRIEVPTNRTELRRLLRFLDEDYYESPLSRTRFISNSKRVAD
ncbi:Kiwa anti-phage protein KwaB-like domain-containing protein [Pseudomonas sp. QTF5]|uniref:Kiwa anti-phage protein KwaB-like domain-containing protein n=1 Tax=Pseudomonas sp. QTF5 TaxID=1435425 RepID=UPI0004BE39C7|nr:Kiwa anti-phage protein KwaB-like domain-containing protein [Pseudomonas sp. QTF5]